MKQFTEFKHYAYVGECMECGKIHAMCISAFREREYVAKEVYDMIIAGLRVKHVTVDEANQLEFSACRAYSARNATQDMR